MHLVTLTATCRRVMDPSITPLEPGQYLAEDLNAAEIMVDAERGTAICNHFDYSTWSKRLDRFDGHDGAMILVVSPGGLGDGLMLGPTLRALKRKYPTSSIHVCCRDRMKAVFEGLDYPDGFTPYPLSMRDMEEFDAVAFMENVNEAGEDARTKPSVDNRAARCGVSLGDDRKPEWKISEMEAELVKRYERKSPLRIGVQLAAAAPNRIYPQKQLFEATLKLYHGHGAELLLFGTPHTTQGGMVPPQFRDRITDLAADGLTFRQSAAVVATCDVMLTPDSSLMHVAGSLDIPCVALFGPIDWKTRTDMYSSVRAIQGREGCPIAPCFFHPRSSMYFPPDQACAKTGVCAPLANITPDDIVKTVLKYAKA